MLRKEGLSHAERVYTAVRWGEPDLAPTPENDRLLRSWERSLESYGLDPGRTAQPRILTAGNLRERQEPLESFLRIARHGVRRLHEQVSDANYVVLLTDAEGVTIDFVGNASQDKELKKAGLYLGSIWTESEEGTCGVGTAIIDRVPITVHKREHFRAPNTTLTCSSAPVFDVDGRLLAILDASALYSPDERKSQNLVLKFVSMAAEMIENAYFLERHKHAWVMQLSRRAEFLHVQTEYLIAFDEAGHVLAANRGAQRELLPAGKSHRPLSNFAVEDLFQLRHQDLLRLGASAQFVFPVCSTSAVAYHAHMRAPQRLQRSALAVSPPPTAMPDETSTPAVAHDSFAAEDTAQIEHADRITAISATLTDTTTSISTAPKSNANSASDLDAVNERDTLVGALRASAWHVAAAARALRVSRATLYRKMHHYGIVSPNQADRTEN